MLFKLSSSFRAARDRIQPFCMPASGTRPCSDPSGFCAALADYSSECASEIYRATGLNWHSYDQEQVPNWIFPKSLGEWSEKLGKPGFYSANALAASTVALDVCALLEGRSSEEVGKAQSLGVGLVWDSELMLTLLGQRLLGLTQRLGRASRANIAKPEHLIDTWESLVFGSQRGEFEALTTVAAGISILRVALELFVKEGFGFVAIRKKASEEPVLLSLNEILRILTKLQRDFGQELQLGVPVSTLTRLSKWANLYVHTGIDTFIWVPVWAGRLMSSLLVRPSRSLPGLREVNFGMRLSQRVYDEGRQRIEASAKRKCQCEVAFIDTRPTSSVLPTPS